MALDLERALLTARLAAQRAGEVTLRYFGQEPSHTQKSTAIDLVTEADRAAEACLVEDLRAAYPEHRLYGEEGGVYDGAAAEYRWYLDPVDGTTNFAQGIPIYAVSVALCDAKDEPLVAVVLNPAYGREFSAIRGRGAHLDGRRLQVSRKEQLAEAVVASGFAYDKWENPDDNLAQWGAMMKRTRGIRRLGAAALDLCFVAMGRLDAYWERRLGGPWDVMGGILIVEEAAGRVSDYRGERSEKALLGQEIVASNGHLHDEICGILRAADG